MQLVLYNMVLIINHAWQSKKKIAIVKVYYKIGAYNNNACYLIIIFKLWTYVVEYIYLNDLNFYLDIADLYMHFGTNFVFFLKIEECSCHQFYSIYYSFSLYTLYYYIRCQLYLLVSTATYDYMNRIVIKRQQYFADLLKVNSKAVI